MNVAGSRLAYKDTRLGSSDDKVIFIYSIEDGKEKNLEKIPKHSHKHAHKKTDMNT
jgi:hypothetical protein